MQKNDARIVTWMFKARPQDRIFAEELKNRITLNNSTECLQNRRLRCWSSRENGRECLVTRPRLCKTFSFPVVCPEDDPEKYGVR